MTPPPCCAWSPSPALAERKRSRNASWHPSFANYDAHKKDWLPTHDSDKQFPVSDKIMRTRKGGGAPIGVSSHVLRHASRMSPFVRLGRRRLSSRAAFRRGIRQGERLSSSSRRFLRPDLAGVTRFDVSRVYRAPRRSVVMPAER